MGIPQVSLAYDGLNTLALCYRDPRVADDKGNLHVSAEFATGPRWQPLTALWYDTSTLEGFSHSCSPKMLQLDAGKKTSFNGEPIPNT